MKNREKDKLTVIRMVKASLQNEAIKLKKDRLTDDEELTVLSRELKQRKDSLHEFSNANRSDLVDKVQKELDILEAYMPEQLTEEEPARHRQRDDRRSRGFFKSGYGQSDERCHAESQRQGGRRSRQ